MKVYAIWDNRIGEFVTPSSAKRFWVSKGAAKNAILGQISTYSEKWKNHFTNSEVSQDWLKNRREYDPISFKDQTRYECREYDLDNLAHKIV